MWLNACMFMEDARPFLRTHVTNTNAQNKLGQTCAAFPKSCAPALKQVGIHEGLRTRLR